MSRRKQDKFKQLMHWNHNGEVVLKNKVKEAILRENAHEERSLDATLSYLDRHKFQEGRHLVNKQLVFATTAKKCQERKEENFAARRRSWSDPDSRIDHDESHHRQANFDAKRKWRKAISSVRSAVRTNPRQKQPAKKRTVLPPLAAQKSSRRPKTIGAHAQNDLTLPAITGNRSRSCLEDPRFKKLQEILSQGRKSPERKHRKDFNQDSRVRSFSHYL